MHCACCEEISHFVNVAKRARVSVLFLLRFNNFALTMGFYWSYMLLPKLFFFTCSWLTNFIVPSCEH